MTIAPRAFPRFALPEIAKTLEVARTQKVDIPEAVLQAVNMKFSEIPKSGSVPWPEELEILNYRSLFNAIAAPVPSSRTIGTGSSVFVEIGQGSRPLFKNLALERFNQVYCSHGSDGMFGHDLRCLWSHLLPRFASARPKHRRNRS